MAGERDDQRQQPDQGSFEGQRDEHCHPHPDRRTDQREELQEEGQDSEHHGVWHANQRHREAGVRPHDKRHGQLASRVLADGRAYGDQGEVINIFPAGKEFAHAGDQLPAFHQQVNRDHDHEKDVDYRSQRSCQDAEDRP